MKLLFITCLLFASTLAQTAHCPDGTVELAAYKGRCFAAHPAIRTWDSISSVCYDNGGYEAKIDKRVLGVAFKAALSPNVHLFIALHDGESQGTWLWADGSRATVFPWDNNQPNNAGNQDVVLVVTTGHWHDLPEIADRQIRVACEYNAIICPVGTTYLPGYEGRCFAPVPGVRSWESISNECYKAGGYEAKIDSQELGAAFVSTLSTDTDLYLGMHDGVEEGRFVWADGSPVRANFWSDGEPDNAGDDGEDLVHLIGNGSWNDVPTDAGTAVNIACEFIPYSCPTGSIMLEGFEGRCFRAVQGFRTLESVSTTCYAAGGYEAHIDSQELGALFKSALSLHSHLMIGLHDTETDGHFFWVDGTSPEEYFWDNGEPDDEGLVRVMNGGLWRNDIQDTGNVALIACEFDIEGGSSDIDKSRSYQRCGDEEIIAVEAGITAMESILENGMITLSISFPGYMDLVNISLQDSTMELPYENWEIVTADECLNDTTTTTVVSLTELMDTTNMTLDGSSYIFSMNVELRYASYIESTDTFALLPVMNTVHFSVDAPSSYVVTVRFLLEEGSDLLVDIMSYSVIEDDAQSVVLVDFQTYVSSSYEFIGNGSITTDYFNAGSSTVELTSTSDFEHPEFGAGKVQMWTLTLVEPSTECTTGIHKIPVTLDLANAEYSETVGLNIILADHYRKECSNNVGESEISSVVSVDAGEGFVLLNDTEVTVLMDSVLYFSIDFSSSEITPSTVSIVRADGSQDGVQVCDDCLESLALTCSTCDETGVSSGAIYNFGISMSSNVFNVPDGGSIFSTVEMDFEFAFTYDGRRALLKVASSKSGARFFLRDYDCHSPTGLFGDVKEIACPTPGYVKKAFCVRSGAWEDNNSCPALGTSYSIIFAWPLTKIVPIAGGVVSLAILYLAGKFYALKPTNNYSTIQV